MSRTIGIQKVASPLAVGRQNPFENTEAVSSVLVLGHRMLAQKIAESLEKLGYLVYCAYDFKSRDLNSILKEYDSLTALHGHQFRFVHPGVTEWSQRAEFVSMVTAMAMIPLAPSVKNLSLFSNKVNLLSHAEALGIPHLVLSFDPLQSVREIEQLMVNQKLSFPLVLKNAQTGAGFGVLVVQNLEDLRHKVHFWIDQLRHLFGEVQIFIEKALSGSRHYTLPFAAFKNGEVIYFPVTESSLQLRNRKLIEFCPAPSLAKKTLEKMREIGQLLCRDTAYVGVGALEFLVEGDKIYLIEAVPRLSTGFVLWEKTSQESALDWQIRTYLEQEPYKTQKQIEISHSALLVRLYAEDPVLQLPSSGEWIETNLDQQWKQALEDVFKDNISPYIGDFVVAEHLVSTTSASQLATRKRVIQKMIHLLDEIWIAGEFQTNQKFLIELLSSPFVREDMIYAGYCEEEFIPELRPPLPVLKKMAETVDFLLKQKYPDAYAKIRSTASDSRLKKYLVSQIWFDILSNDEEVSTNHAYFISKTNRLTGLLCQVVLNIGSTSKIYRCCIFPLASDRMIVRIGPWVQLVRTQVNSQMSSGMSSMMNALVRGKVHEIHFLKDAIVPAHESILVLESLGVLVSHSLPRQAKLLEWKCQLEEVVSLGQELAQIQLIR